MCAPQVVEYSDVESVEFVKAENTRSFEFVVNKKQSAGGKSLRFGAIEKREFTPLAEFVKTKEAFFTVVQRVTCGRTQGRPVRRTRLRHRRL